MALQFGPTKIGAMQYNGVTIGEAMYNGQIVYRSVPPSIYPVSGTWAGTVARYDTVVAATHTIVEAGSYTLTWEVNSTNGRWGTARIATPAGSSDGNFNNPSLATSTRALSPGDMVTFSYVNEDLGNSNTVGSWSIVKN